MASLPTFSPMPLARVREAFNHADWLFELKYDGFRALAYVNGGVKLVSCRNHVYKSFPRLCGALAQHLEVRDAVLDGAIECLDNEGRRKPGSRSFFFLARGRPSSLLHVEHMSWYTSPAFPKEINVDINRILADLKAQREQLDRAIEALKSSAGDGRIGGRRRRKHNISAAGRRRLSLMMKRRWAERRKQKASGRMTKRPVRKAVMSTANKQETA